MAAAFIQYQVNIWQKDLSECYDYFHSSIWKMQEPSLPTYPLAILLFATPLDMRFRILNIDGKILTVYSGMLHLMYENFIYMYEHNLKLSSMPFPIV